MKKTVKSNLRPDTHEKDESFRSQFYEDDFFDDDESDTFYDIDELLDSGEPV